MDLESQRSALRTQGVHMDSLEESYRSAWHHLIMYAEHTWGAYQTGFAPDSEEARGQWNAKASHAYAAGGLVRSIQMEQLVAAATSGTKSARGEGLTNATLQGKPSGYIAGPGKPAVLIYNPPDGASEQVVRVTVPGHLAGANPSEGSAPRFRDADTGEAVPAVVRRFERGDIVNYHNNFDVEIMASGLPAGGHKAYFIEPGGSSSAPDVGVPFGESTVLKIENDRYIVTLSEESGAIRSMVHKATGRELRQLGHPYDIGQCVTERLDADNGRDLIASWQRLGDGAQPFLRSTPKVAGISRTRSLFGEGAYIHSSDGVGVDLELTVTLPKNGDRVDLWVRLRTQPSDDPFAVYHAFPLLSTAGQIWLDIVGGAMRPGLDQAPGTAADWHSVQNWFAVEDEHATVVVASPDVPLVQCTGINSGKWLECVPESNGMVMSWPMNNYWFTNFPIRQGGLVEYRYSIALMPGKIDIKRAGEFGRSRRHNAWGMAVKMLEK